MHKAVGEDFEYSDEDVVGFLCIAWPTKQGNNLVPSFWSDRDITGSCWGSVFFALHHCEPIHP